MYFTLAEENKFLKDETPHAVSVLIIYSCLW